MTILPGTEIPISSRPEPKPRMVWIEPEIEALSVEQTEFMSGVGPDGSTAGSPDCTSS